MALLGEQHALVEGGAPSLPFVGPLARKEQIVEASGEVRATGRQTIDGQEVSRFDVARNTCISTPSRTTHVGSTTATATKHRLSFVEGDRSDLAARQRLSGPVDHATGELLSIANSSLHREVISEIPPCTAEPDIPEEGEDEREQDQNYESTGDAYPSPHHRTSKNETAEKEDEQNKWKGGDSPGDRADTKPIASVTSLEIASNCPAQEGREDGEREDNRDYRPEDCIEQGISFSHS